MLEYSLRQKRDSGCHYMIPFRPGFHRYGFSIHLKVLACPERLHNGGVNVRWYQLSENRINVSPIDDDIFEQKNYQATRFVHQEHFCVAVISNPPPRFDLGGAYIPEKYSVQNDEWKDGDDNPLVFKASFYFAPDLKWHITNASFEV